MSSANRGSCQLPNTAEPHQHYSLRGLKPSQLLFGEFLGTHLCLPNLDSQAKWILHRAGGVIRQTAGSVSPPLVRKRRMGSKAAAICLKVLLSEVGQGHKDINQPREMQRKDYDQNTQYGRNKQGQEYAFGIPMEKASRHHPRSNHGGFFAYKQSMALHGHARQSSGQSFR